MMQLRPVLLTSGLLLALCAGAALAQSPGKPTLTLQMPALPDPVRVTLEPAKTALLVDALEAVLGALYVDSGLEEARRVILQHILGPELDRLAHSGSCLPLSDYKSALQEKLQAMGRSQPAYVLVKEQGPEHNKTFTVEARLETTGDRTDTEFVGRAEGSTKKDAEQGAARQLLDYLVSLPESVGGRGHGRGRLSSES